MKNFIIDLNIPSTDFQLKVKNNKLSSFLKLVLGVSLFFIVNTSQAETYMVFAGFPDNNTDNKPALDAALNLCDTLFIPSGANYYKISGTVNIPTGKTIIFDNNAKFNVTGNLKGNQTRIIAGENEIFKNTSIINGSWSADTVFVDWTGAIGDGVTDDFASLNLFFRLLGITENNQAVLGVNKEYYSKNQILHTVLKELNLDGRGSRIFRKYADMTAGESILRLTGSISTTKTITANLIAGQLTAELNNTESLSEGMGIEVLSNELYGKEYMGGDSWHYHYKGLLSTISSINGDIITMTDSIPHDFNFSDLRVVRFYNINPVSVKNLNLGSEEITGSNKMTQLSVSQLFGVELENITCDPLGYSGISAKSIYNGFFNKLTFLKPGTGEDDYVFGVYGLIPSLNVNCVYDSLYARATTHGIAFTNEPSYNCLVKNSDFKASWNGSNGVDSHASKWVKFENCIIYGAQGNWGTFIFENCEMHEVANGQGNIWNEREGAGRGNLEVYFTNCNFYTKTNGTRSTSIFYRYPTIETSTNKYSIKNNNFYLENYQSYLFNTVGFGTATDIQPITIESNNFYGSGTLYLPKNYSTTIAANGGVFTFKDNTYSKVYWSAPPFDQFQTIEILNNTPVNENTSDFWVNWDNRPGNINFKNNVFVGAYFWIKGCSGTIVFENNDIYNNQLKSSYGYKNRNYLTGNSNLTFINNNLHNTYWTLTGNQLVAENIYNNELQPNDPEGNFENINTPGSSIETGITMEELSNFTIISRAKMDDITTNAVQNLVGSSITKLYFGFNPSGSTPVARPSIRNVDGTIIRPVLSKFYMDENWHTYVFVMENGVLQAYMDGIAMLSYDASAAFTKIYASGTIHIGGSNSSELWSGPIQSFAIYNRALSLEEANSFSENPNLILEGELYRLVNQSDNLNPKGHWAFDETTGSIAVDSSENNFPGTLVNGPVWKKGMYGNSIQLDGVNDRVDCGTISGLDMGTDDFTISTWVKMDVAQRSYPTIVSKGGSSNTNAGYWFYLSGSNLKFVFGDGNGRLNAASNTVNIKDNQWHHIAVTVDRNGSAVFYVDGIASGTYDVSSYNEKNISNPSKQFSVGSLATTSTTFLKGFMDDLRIYNRTLTESEVANLAVPFESDENIVAYWEFEENEGNLATDSTGNGFCGTLINGPSWTIGSKGHAINFDGTNDKVESSCASELDMGTGDMSISAWVKMGETQLSYPTILSKGGTSNANPGYWLYVSGSVIKIVMADGTERISKASSTVNIKDDLWHHIAVTLDRDENAVFYLDGENVGISDISSLNNKDISNPVKSLTIGSAASSSTTFFNGSIDGVRIFNLVLPETSIDSLFDIHDSQFATYLALDENSGYLAPDMTGNGNDGTLENGPEWEVGIVGNSVLFDGRDDKINCGTASSLDISNSDFTAVAWVNMGPSQSSYSTIFSKGGYNSSKIGYWFYLGNGALHFAVSNGSQQYIFDSENVFITDNIWHHVAVTIDRNSFLNFYLDGVNIGNYDATIFQQDNITNSSASLILGSANYRSTFFKGKIDEFRVFRTALTEAEIIELASVQQENSFHFEVNEPNFKIEENNLKIYPNPFITNAIINFSSKYEQNIQAAIFDLNGNKVNTLSEGLMNVGENMLTWDGNDNLGREVSKGLYVVQIISETDVLTKTIVKMR